MAKSVIMTRRIFRPLHAGFHTGFDTKLRVSKSRQVKVEANDLQVTLRKQLKIKQIDIVIHLEMKYSVYK